MVIPSTPRAVRALRTAWSLNGLIMAVTIFMAALSACHAANQGACQLLSPVDRIERSEIRGKPYRVGRSPGFTRLNPGYTCALRPAQTKTRLHRFSSVIAKMHRIRRPRRPLLQACLVGPR